VVAAVTSLIGFIAGVVMASGIVLMVAGFSGAASRPARPVRDTPDLSAWTVRAAVCVGSGLVVFLLTGWVAGMVMGGLAASVAPSVIGAKARREAVIARTEAVAEWAEMVRDTMAASAGLAGAIKTTAAVAPMAIRDEVQALAWRVERDSLRSALAAFAEEVEDPAADMLAIALGAAATGHARNLGDVLGKAATEARAEASMRIAVEAGRARAWTTAKVVIGVTVSVVVFMLLFSRDYLAPFDTASGQLMLMVIVGLFGVGLWWLARMAQLSPGARVLVTAERLG
jgi:tight adherence protein B